MRTLQYILPVISVFLASCSQHRINVEADPSSSDRQKDSLEIINTVKNVYKWHDATQSELAAFNVVVVDSFQTGIDFPSFEKTYKAINESHLFSNAFIANYKELAEIINHKLITANPKYHNEINFAYQDEDPWTQFQDEAGHFWDDFLISDFTISPDSASFKWRIGEKYAETNKYLVKLVKENKKWVVSYLDGLIKKCTLNRSNAKIECMNTSDTHNQRIAKMSFATVYPLYVAKVEKKGRTVQELHQVIEWLTGFNNKKLQELIKEKVTFETFFQKAKLNPNAHLITGMICGYRIEDIENPLTKQVRYLDKLVDELAKGRKMDKILRSA